MHWFGPEPPETTDIQVTLVDEYDGLLYTHTVTIPAGVEDPTEAIEAEIIEGDITPPLAEHVQDWAVLDYNPPGKDVLIMSTKDRLLDDIATRLGITPTEAYRGAWVYESDDFDLEVRDTVSGNYEAHLVLDGRAYATLACRDHGMLAAMVRAALDHESLRESTNAA